MNFSPLWIWHLQERNAVALEEKKDLVEVGRAVERVVEHVEVHLGRQKLHSQLPEWEAITKSVLSHLFILGFENTTSDQSSIGLNQ